jgi:hypothetical protein
MKTISPMELKVPVYDRSFEYTLFDPLTMWMLFAQICVVLNLEKVSCIALGGGGYFSRLNTTQI